MVQDDSQLIIRLEPINVDIIEAIEITYTEHFLFFFFPRERKKYRYILDVKVSVSIVNVSEIQHEKQIQKNALPEFIKYKIRQFRQVK
ncbi:DUF4312 family protein [Peribacillus frigoritolerans]